MILNQKLQLRQHTLTVIIFTMVALTLLGCGAAPPAPAESSPPTPIDVQLSWLHTIEFAGFYLAEAEGYFAEENLEVGLSAGGYDDDGNFIDPIERVISGEADFGIADAGTLLSARAEGKPLVAIATIYQRSPIAFVSLGEKNIVRPEDLVGATVQLDPYTSGVVFEAMLSSQGIDRSQVNEVSRADFTLAPLLSGEADVLDGWVTNEVTDLTLQDYTVNVILPSEYGVVMYPDVIFTTEDMIANNSDLVERFLQATVRGTQGAIDDPDKAAKLAVTYDDTLSLEKETAAMSQSLPLINPAGSRPGMMRAEAWETAHQILLDQGIMSEPIELESVYTLAYLDKVYAE